MARSLRNHDRSGGHAATGTLHQHGATTGGRQPGPIDDHPIGGQPGRRQAGCLLEGQRRGLGHEVAPRYGHRLGKGPLMQLREQRAPGVERLVAATRGRVSDDRVDDHVLTLRAHAGRVTSQNHRQPVRR